MWFDYRWVFGQRYGVAWPNQGFKSPSLTERNRDRCPSYGFHGGTNTRLTFPLTPQFASETLAIAIDSLLASNAIDAPVGDRETSTSCSLHRFPSSIRPIRFISSLQREDCAPKKSRR